MTDTLLCPICETQNAPDATNCEVCGERLTPAAPGEVIPPEQSVSTTLPSITSTPEAAPSSLDPIFVTPKAQAPSTTLQGIPAEQALPPALYSSITGEAFPKGSPTYAEGFGPLGEELVAQPPESPAAAHTQAPQPAQADAPPAQNAPPARAAACASRGQRCPPPPFRPRPPRR